MKVIFKRTLLFLSLLSSCVFFIYAGDGQIDIAYLPFTISSSGSYIVVKDLSLSTQNTDGITISADNVTLDLNGHTLTGAGKATGSNGWGIRVLSPAKNHIVIRNGSVRDWRGDGISAQYAGNSKFEDLKCYNNGWSGMLVGSGSSIVANVVTGCICSNNGMYGMMVANSSIVINCIAYNNGSSGIAAGGICDIKGNNCSYNGYSGITTGSGCNIIGNECANNGYNGILALYNCVIAENTCGSSTGSNGIEVTGSCRVVNNVCTNNTTGAGINVSASGSRNNIENNLVTGNSKGISSNPAVDNFITGNRASNNTTDYDIAAGNVYGTILDMTAGGQITTTNYHTNFRF